VGESFLLRPAEAHERRERVIGGGVAGGITSMQSLRLTSAHHSTGRMRYARAGPAVLLVALYRPVRTQLPGRLWRWCSRRHR